MAWPDRYENPGEARSRDFPGEITTPVLVVQRLPDREGLRVAGEVDLVTRHGWAEVVALLGTGTPGHLDMSGLSFLDVRGTAALVDAARRSTPGTQLTLYRPPWCVRRVLDLFDLDEGSGIVIHDDTDDNTDAADNAKKVRRRAENHRQIGRAELLRSAARRPVTGAARSATRNDTNGVSAPACRAQAGLREGVLGPDPVDIRVSMRQRSAQQRTQRDMARHSPE